MQSGAECIAYNAIYIIRDDIANGWRRAAECHQVTGDRGVYLI